MGYYVYVWIARQGYSALMVPGWLMGMGAGWCVRHYSIPLAVTCAVLALPLAVFSEWSASPFVQDNSLPFFLAHVHKLPPITLIMIAAGCYFAYSSVLRARVR